MDPKDLPTLWRAPDNSRLTRKQISIRLPIHVAAKISALCDLYPRKSRTEIIGDLLAAALEIAAAGIPSEDPLRSPDDLLPGEFTGERARYQALVRKYEQELEAEAQEK